MGAARLGALSGGGSCWGMTWAQVGNRGCQGPPVTGARLLPKREPAGPPQVSLVAGGSGEPMRPAPGRRLGVTARSRASAGRGGRWKPEASRSEGWGGPSKLGNAWKSEQLGMGRRAGAAAGKGAAVRALGTRRDGTAVERPGAHGGSGGWCLVQEGWAWCQGGQGLRGHPGSGGGAAGRRGALGPKRDSDRWVCPLVGAI